MFICKKRTRAKLFTSYSIFVCSFAKREHMQHCTQMIQTWSQIQYLRPLIHDQWFSTIEYVFFIAISFCIFVCKKWTRAKLCTSESNMISYLIFKAIINTYSTILNYKVCFVEMPICLFVWKKWNRAKLCTSESHMI